MNTINAITRFKAKLKAARYTVPIRGYQWSRRTWVGWLRNLKAKRIERLNWPEDFNLGLATTETCNARCVFCNYPYVSDAGYLDKTALMPVELSDAVTDEAAREGVRQIGLCPIVGDSLVDPHLERRIQRCHQQGITTMVTTNGILLAKRVQTLLSSGLNLLMISTEGFNAEWYRKVYGVDCYRQVLEGIKSVLASNEASGFPVEIHVNLRNGQPLAELFSERDYLDLRAAFKHPKHRINVLFEVENWGGRHVKKANLPGELQTNARRVLRHPKVPCHGLRSMLVRHDGTVRFCGCAFERHPGDEMMGPAKYPELSLRELSEESNRLAERFRRNDLPQCCRGCSNRTGLHSKGHLI